MSGSYFCFTSDVAVTSFPPLFSLLLETIKFVCSPSDVLDFLLPKPPYVFLMMIFHGTETHSTTCHFMFFFMFPRTIDVFQSTVQHPPVRYIKVCQRVWGALDDHVWTRAQYLQLTTSLHPSTPQCSVIAYVHAYPPGAEHTRVHPQIHLLMLPVKAMSGPPTQRML